MKAKIHPKYTKSKVTCSCGETFTTGSTLPEIRVELCSKCHPFYTGKQKFIDSGGRIEKFRKKFAKQIEEKEALEKKKKEERQSVKDESDRQEVAGNKAQEEKVITEGSHHEVQKNDGDSIKSQKPIDKPTVDKAKEQNAGKEEKENKKSDPES